MTLGIADTSVFIADEADRPLDSSSLPDRIGVSIITIGELRAGVLTATDLETRDRRLLTLTRALSFDPLPVDDRVAEAWARLRIELRDSGQRMPVNDSWIAATALAHTAAIVTQDTDYADIPGLQVITV
jgi:predicted nucleic acid-binding protein